MNPSWYVFPITEKAALQTRTARIFNIICEEYKVEEKKLKSLSRVGKLVEARHMAMYLLMTETTLSCVKIGVMFNRDHSSVLHARNKMLDLFKLYPDDALRVSYLIDQVNNHIMIHSHAD